MKIAYVAAGAGGMYCGSCMHDNTLAAALQRQGHDVALLPTYTPMRTDEASVASDRLFYGAINVYLGHKSRLFRRLPRFLGRLLDRPGLLDWVARKASSTDARELGDLTLAVLQGEAGPQRRELARLAAWLRDDFRPDVVHLTNSLFLGMARELRQSLGVPIVVNVQGEDLFIDQLPEPSRSAVVAELRTRAGDADIFVAPNRYYAAHMAKLLDVPAERMRVLPLGIQLDGFPDAPRVPEGPPVLGYLARICPEKGLDGLVAAFRALAPKHPELVLRIAGYLADHDRPFLEAQLAELGDAGLAERVEVVGEVDRDGKIDFLTGLSLLCVPTVYRESKGLFSLEGLAAGVPVVLPDHGTFPEIVEATGGGRLFEPGSTEALTRALDELLSDPQSRRRMAEAGHAAVHRDRGAPAMAEATLDLYRNLLAAGGERATA